MIEMKRVSKLRESRKRASTVEYVIVLSLFCVVIIGALAAAATKTTAGHALLRSAIDAVFG